MVHAERSRPNLKRAVDARRKVKEEAPTMPATNPELFPRSSRYNPEWLIAGLSGAANPLWMAEWLTAAIDLQPGMRVLDLGCGRATSSILATAFCPIRRSPMSSGCSTECVGNRNARVIAGLDPAIHPVRTILSRKMVARVKPAGDD